MKRAILMTLWSLTPFVVTARAATIDPSSGDSSTHFIVQKVSVDDEANDATSPKKVFIASGTEPKAGGPWLGIQFGPVSKALSTQLNLDAAVGQMVMNVVEGSPADQAGLQQYDIIVEVDGQKASAKIDEFMEMVRAFAPGESHTLTLVRGGQRVQTNVTVGERPAEIGPTKYKFDDSEWSQGRVLSRSGLLQKDPGGNWVFKGFNDLNLPDVWKSIPLPQDMDFHLSIPFGTPGQNQFFIHRGKGESVRIETDDRGQITVTKTVNENGKETTTTKTYANREELEAADPDTAKMLKEDGAGFRFQWGDKPFNLKLDGEIRARIEEAMKNADEAMKNSDVLLRRLHESSGQAGGDGPAAAFGFSSRKARTSFDVQPDGRIRVTTRRGQEELTTTYENAEALRQADPELYRKYERLQERHDKDAE